jgi:L-alanine-DL-glutamate epimerase-like enolase superfamily enzyme
VSHAIERVDARAFTIPTERVESDGTLEWSSTTLVVVRVRTTSGEGLGYSYADASAVDVVRRVLGPAIGGADARCTELHWLNMQRAVRNIGRRGIAAYAISAVDTALWDYKAKAAGMPLYLLLGGARDSVMLYASGGFTSASLAELEAELSGYADAGFDAVKMKVGRDPDFDPERVRVARRAIGDKVELFVDANGACDRREAALLAKAFSREGVTWFEEPVSSDDAEGLCFLRAHVPEGMAIAAGEYCNTAEDFRALTHAVDVMQADATRCLGVTGFLRAAAVCESASLPLSTHTAPSLHLHLACAVAPTRHLEWFSDHVRIEGALFEGARVPERGRLSPHPTAPGLGISLREKEANQHAVRP